MEARTQHSNWESNVVAGESPTWRRIGVQHGDRDSNVVIVTATWRSESNMATESNTATGGLTWQPRAQQGTQDQPSDLTSSKRLLC